MRFNIEYSVKSTDRTPTPLLESSILFKYIFYVVIYGVKHYRPSGNDSKETQIFYHFIEKNRFLITEIQSIDGKQYFLKDGKYHSDDSSCFINPSLKFNYYAINGYILSEEEERRFLLKRKIEKLTKLTK